MRYPAASPSLCIKIVTSFVLFLTGVFILLSVYEPALLYAGIFLGGVSLVAYLRAPVAYDLTNAELTVVYRLGQRRFKSVVNCTSMQPPFSIAIRLWGNGGMFAGTGIFWNRTYGIFRAYVTRGKPSELVWVETERQKILISPNNPGQFVEGAGFSKQPSGGFQREDRQNRPIPTSVGPGPRASGSSESRN